MADQGQQQNLWQQLGSLALAALAPVVAKALQDAFAFLASKLEPWNGTDRRGSPPEPPAAGGTP